MKKRTFLGGAAALSGCKPVRNPAATPPYLFELDEIGLADQPVLFRLAYAFETAAQARRKPRFQETNLEETQRAG